MVSNTHSRSGTRPVVAFGPELPGVGSWDWVGHDLAHDLRNVFDVRTFCDEPSACDVVVVVKQPPSERWLAGIDPECHLIYCPIDSYGCAAEIDADWRLLRRCTRVVVHCPLLCKYFRSYAPTVSLDHHLKYTAPLREDFQTSGPILWTGVWLNLDPLVRWTNEHPLPAELQVLTNLEGHERRTPREFGFNSRNQVSIEAWTPERHRKALSDCRASIDIKGGDFRARHKPAAKALDVIASGVPLAMNHDSSSVRCLREQGFEVARPEETDRWLSRKYWEQTREFGRTINDQLTLPRIAEQFQRIIFNVLGEQRNVEAA